LLGLAGLFAASGISPIESDEGNKMLRLIPGHLEFGTADSVVHLLTGIVFCVAGWMRPELGEQAKGMYDKARDKLGV
jgi:hypothetical protein